MIRYVISLVGLAFLNLQSPGLPGQSRPPASHGTVNIVLANPEGLVAVTDSRLTYSDGNHVDNGRKLFKIDDKTICTMAGRYAAPVKEEEGLSLYVPRVIDSLSKVLRTSPMPSLSAKLDLLSKLLRIALQTNAITLHALGNEPDLSQPVEITMAGYDTDNKMRVASILLQVQDAEHNYEVAQYAVSSSHDVCGARSEVYQGYTETVRDTFCRIAGEPKYATLFMASPSTYSGANPILLAFKKDLSIGTLAGFTLNNLRTLATGLEEETAANSTVVGGPPQIATLQAGKVSLFFRPILTCFSRVAQ